MATAPPGPDPSAPGPGPAVPHHPAGPGPAAPAPRPPAFPVRSRVDTRVLTRGQAPGLRLGHVRPRAGRLGAVAGERRPSIRAPAGVPHLAGLVGPGGRGGPARAHQNERRPALGVV